MKLADLIKPMEGVKVAVVHEIIEEIPGWFMYLINEKDVAITEVLIQSFGKGEMDAWPVKTSTLRHRMERLDARSFKRIEMLIEEVFFLENTYWVSFYEGEQVYDKQFVFPPDSINEQNCIDIPMVNLPGILGV
jgi:hypothetical protein